MHLVEQGIKAKYDGFTWLTVVVVVAKDRSEHSRSNVPSAVGEKFRPPRICLNSAVAQQNHGTYEVNE